MVVELAEYFLQFFDPGDLAFTMGAEETTKKLKGVTQPLRGDPHVMELVSRFRG